MLPGNDEIAFTEFISRYDLDIGLGGGYAFEVFQRLFDVTQIEQVTRLGGHGVPGVGKGAAVVAEADGMNASRNDLQGKDTAVQVLRFGENAGGDVAAFDDSVLDA